MRKLNQAGASSILTAALVALVVLLIGAIGFGIWSYGSQQDYKNNVDQKVAQAVQAAIITNSANKDKQFAEQLKQPLKSYKGQDDYGGVIIKYPRSWAAYVDESNTGDTPIDGYFHPSYVPGIQSDTNFALRVQVTSQKYDEELAQFNEPVQSGAAKVKAYRAPKVSKTLGVLITGQVENDKNGIMAMFPLRDKTLKVWTLSPEHISDFNKYILPNLSFKP